MIVNKESNIAKVTKGCEKDFFIVGFSATGYRGLLYIGNVYFPANFIGKKVRVKIEVIKNE